MLDRFADAFAVTKVAAVIHSLAQGGREGAAVGDPASYPWWVSAETPRRPVSPLRGRKKVPRVVREREMLEVAGRVFAQRGFHAASMEEIAEGAGVSKPMIYNYFGSKEGLYFAYIELAGQRMLARMRNAVQAAGERAEERLWASALAFFGHVDDNRDEWSVLFGELASRGAPFSREVSGIRAAISDGTAALFDEVLDGTGLSPEQIGGTEPLAHAFVGAGESLANWWLDHPEESQAAMAARLMNVAWIGLNELLQNRVDPWPLDREPESANPRPFLDALAPPNEKARVSSRVWWWALTVPAGPCVAPATAAPVRDAHWRIPRQGSRGGQRPARRRARDTARAGCPSCHERAVSRSEAARAPRRARSARPASARRDELVTGVGIAAGAAEFLAQVDRREHVDRDLRR